MRDHPHSHCFVEGSRRLLSDVLADISEHSNRDRRDERDQRPEREQLSYPSAPVMYLRGSDSRSCHYDLVEAA